MTITTAQQLAEAPWRPRYEAHREDPPRCFRVGGEVTLENGRCPECGWSEPEDRAAVLALADRLEAEARALRESVKEGP